MLAPFRDDPEVVVLDAPPGNSGSALYWNLAKGGALADVDFRLTLVLLIGFVFFAARHASSAARPSVSANGDS